MAYISEKTLQTVKQMITERDVEMCGNLLQPSELGKYGIVENKDEGLLLYVENVGNENSCQNNTFTKYTWHTHSKSSKGYPSVADLFVPLRKTPDTSIIFTIWGIWELHAGQKYAKELTEERREFLKVNYLEKVLNKIYEYTDRGRAYPLSEKQYSAVTQLTASLNKLIQEKLDMRFVAFFTDWREIKDNYNLKFE
jgi:hypothetical protein